MTHPFAPAPQWLLDETSRYEPRSHRPDPTVELDLPASIARAIDYLENAAPEAIENAAGDHTTYSVANRVMDFGVSEEKAAELMLDHWNEQKAHPPWSPDDLERKVGNAWRYRKDAPGHAAPEAHFKVEETPEPIMPTAEAYTKPRRQRRWVLGTLALLGKVTGIIAPPGAGKSTLTIAIAVSIATGRDLLGMKVRRPGKVLLWNNEDDADEMYLRLQAVLRHFDIPESELYDADGSPRLYLRSGEEERLLVAKKTIQGGKEIIATSTQAKDLASWARGNDVRAIIADPLVETHEADENDNVQMAAVGAAYRGIAQGADCAVFVVHHTRKLPSGSSEGHAGNMDSARGAGALAGVVRVAVTLYGMSERDAKRLGVEADRRAWYVRLDGAKANLSEPSAGASWFERVSVKVPVIADSPIGGGDGTGEAFEGPDGQSMALESVGVLAPVQLQEVKTERGDSAAAVKALSEILPFGQEVAAPDAVRRMGDASPIYRFENEGRDFKNFRERLERAVGDGAVVGDCRISLVRRKLNRNEKLLFVKTRTNSDNDGSGAFVGD